MPNYCSVYLPDNLPNSVLYSLSANSRAWNEVSFNSLRFAFSLSFRHWGWRSINLSDGHSSSHIWHGKAILIVWRSLCFDENFCHVIHSCFWEIIYATWSFYIANLAVVIEGNAPSIFSSTITDLLAIKLLIRFSLSVISVLLILILDGFLVQMYTGLGLLCEIIYRYCSPCKSVKFLSYL